ncbi:MAG: maleylacetoacetate isomerase [Oligoflexales bacterium]
MSYTLYHYWRSSCSWRVRWALELKKVAYKKEAINILQGDHTKAKFLAINSGGQVPTLALPDGTVLSESVAIMEYLEEAFPKPALLPTDPVSRARVRELVQIICAGTQPLQNLKVMAQVSSDQSVKAAWAAHWIKQGLTAFEAKVRKTHGTYSVGGEVTMADLALVPQYYNARRYNADVSELPIVTRIFHACMKLESCQKAMPESQPDAVK